MKTVFTNSEIPHLWAHQTQASARNGKGSLFFDGSTIFSYGRHFAIARHVENAKHEKAILLTTERYSVTTAKHITEVRRAIPSSAKIFYVPDPLKEVTGSTIRDMENDAADLLLKSKHATTRKAYLLEAANSKIEMAKEMVKFFALNYNVLTPEGLENVAADIQKAREERTRQQALAAKRQREKWAQELKDWQSGVFHHIPYLPEAYARIEGNELVTTKGARVPLEHVKKAWPMVKALIHAGKTYKANGHTIHLGHYKLDFIDAQGNVKAGCHLFERAEVERIGGLIEKL